MVDKRIDKGGMGGIRLINGDCLEAMDKLIAENVKADAIITDPPYGTTACKWDSVIPFEPMWERLKRIIKPKGAIVLFGSEPFSSALRMSNIKEYKYDWVWDKRLPSGFQIAKFRPMQRHENITLFCNGSPCYYPIMTEQKRRKGGGFTVASESSPLAYVDGVLRDYNEKYPQSILEFYKRDKDMVHPTQKPVALLEYLIRTYTNEGETVLDFTAGSFSTAIACLNTKRDFIGIEKDDKYFQIGKDRIDKHLLTLDYTPKIMYNQE